MAGGLGLESDGAANRQLDRERDLGVIERAVFGVSHANLDLDRRRGGFRLGMDRDIDPAGDVTHKPAGGLPPRPFKVALLGVVSPQGPPPEVSDQQGGDMPLAEGLGNQRGDVVPLLVTDLGQGDRPRLDPAHAAEGLEVRHGRQPHAFLFLGLPRAHPGL